MHVGTVVTEEQQDSVPADAVMRFVAPLWGFPDVREYALTPTARHGLYWLQSTGEEAVTFVLADPFVVNPAYAIDLGENERKALQIENPDDAFALIMMTLPNAAGESATANFRAPVVFNLRARLALQVVNRDEAHDLRQLVSLAAFASRDES